MPEVAACPYCGCTTRYRHFMLCKQRDNSTEQLVTKCQPHAAHAVAIDPEGNVDYYAFENFMPANAGLRAAWVRDQYMRDENAKLDSAVLTMDDMQELSIYLLHTK